MMGIDLDLQRVVPKVEEVVVVEQEQPKLRRP
jgi:hypothetical protein